MKCECGTLLERHFCGGCNFFNYFGAELYCPKCKVHPTNLSWNFFTIISFFWWFILRLYLSFFNSILHNPDTRLFISLSCQINKPWFYFNMSHLWSQGIIFFNNCLFISNPSLLCEWTTRNTNKNQTLILLTERQSCWV